MEPPKDVVNWQAFLLGCAAMISCLAVEGVTVVVLMTRLKWRMRQYAVASRHWLAHLLFFSALLILLGSHLVQICIWAGFLYYLDVIGDTHTAVLFAGSTYTTVGFATVNMAQRWQLLSVIMAVTGLFAFGWSTSIMYALSQQIYRSET